VGSRFREEVIGNQKLVLADCLEYLPELEAGSVDAVVTDPPYPNNAGYFTDDIAAAERFLSSWRGQTALVFWTELERPPVTFLPLVAVHIWHRTNVNGRPYEALYHFEADGEKRRSEVWRHCALTVGAGPGSFEFLGHPTQKPVAIMLRCLLKVPSEVAVLDPFMGSGSTLAAAEVLGRKGIGVECDAHWFDVACRRVEAATNQPRLEFEPRPVVKQLRMEEAAHE
jgi:DNA modification methylase